MTSAAQLAYLQARLQARHGDRPSPDEWRMAEASADLSHYLDALGRTALKRWVRDLHPEMAPEEIERLLRAAWRQEVDEVADWSPEDWRPGVEWLRWLPDLPAIDHLVRGEQVPPWMRADPVLREFAFEEPQRRAEALAGLPLAPLGEDDVAAAWLAAWRARLPGRRHEPPAELTALVETLRDHVHAMRAGPAADGQALRNSLAANLARRFRHGAGTVVALFSHLLLQGLALERVRAGIIARRLLPERAEGRSWA
ncbi:hypothetical protein [Wenzhouxiangella sp. XN24]|uniref:hypothetical protein n=1 Tax=Wenzhouxiangella sp. XN24 TaxID=2713569 RepID=UPI0013EA9875|nr:hypothetical protein [Wenzhouxiangella sp. XN24]NGX17057.1 hypothetical protein [Wenzhouxiangella sp. XN24]